MTTTDQREASRTSATTKSATADRNKIRGPRTAEAAAGPTTKESTRTRRSAEQNAQARLRALVMQALDALKARDVHEVDVRDKSQVTDLLIIASGTSSRHVRSIADEVVMLAKQAAIPPLGVEGEQEGEWALVDLGDIVVHVMQPKIREFYGLERLWTVGDQEGDAAHAG